MPYTDIITIDPNRRCGTRVQVLRDFPYLTNEDVQACLAFAADRERKPEIHSRC